MVLLLKVMEAFGISFSDAECDEHAVKLRAEYVQLDDIYLASDLGPSLKKLWKNPGVQGCYGRFLECWLNDPATYYMEAIGGL